MNYSTVIMYTEYCLLVSVPVITIVYIYPEYL